MLMLPDGSALAASHRRQRAPRRGRPLPGHDRARARVRVEPRVRRRRAARHDEQPQLRQPREAAHRLAADRVRPRARRRLPRARRADRRRQRLALQRGRAAGPIYPTPVVGMVGKLPDAARAGRLGLRAARATRSRSRATSRRRSPASELAKLRGEALPDGLPDGRHREGASRRRRRSATRSARASLSSAHDIAEGGFAVAVAECCLAGGIGATLDLGAVARPVGARSSARGPAASSSPATPAALARLARARRRSTSSASSAATR